jgi:pimeloyl-ACP methyl ester carboxylesterase
MKNITTTETRSFANSNLIVRAKLSMILLLLLSTAFITHSQPIQTNLDMNKINSKTIVLIHGAFVSYETWDDWKAYFESKGYTVIVPAWPHKNASAAQMRSTLPSPEIASLRMNELTDYYANIISKLPEKPILIGHSFGGLLTQILVNRGLAAAGIAIHSVPPQGVLPHELSFIRSTTSALGLFTSTKKVYMMSFKTWQYAFTNGMSLEDQKASYEKYTAPESKMIARDGLTSAAKVDFKKEHAPLLIMAGSKDHIIPATLNFRNFKRYAKNNSITDYKEFENTNHYVVGLPTWKINADYILNWINQNSAAPVASSK